MAVGLQIAQCMEMRKEQTNDEHLTPHTDSLDDPSKIEISTEY